MKEAKVVFTDFLTKKNLKMTNQRGLILDVFLKTDKHLSTEDLYHLVSMKDKSIGQVTVYRTLKLMSEAGLAREEDFGDGVKRYEQNFGHEHHDHLICIRCQKKVEFVNHEIEKLQKEIAYKYGFTLTGHKMDLIGICAQCNEKETRQTSHYEQSNQ